MSTDYLEELAALGDGSTPAAASHTVTDFVERNPAAAVLAAAAAGAGLMALLTLMTRREPDPLAPVPLVSSRGIDFVALRRQIADITDRLASAAPIDAAKQRAGQAGESIADGWGAVRDQALDALHRYEPQASAAIKVARENPVLTALVVGAVGALVGSQMLGKPAEATQTQSDPGADV